MRALAAGALGFACASEEAPPAKRARCLDLAIDEDEEAQLVPASGEGSGNALARVYSELDHLATTPHDPRSTTLLGWWRDHQSQFPILAQCAPRYLPT